MSLDERSNIVHPKNSGPAQFRMFRVRNPFVSVSLVDLDSLDLGLVNDGFCL